jgi:hypothetical protein
VVLSSVLQLLITANLVPSLLILSTLMMEVILSTITSVLKRATWRHITKDGILLSHGVEDLRTTKTQILHINRLSRQCGILDVSHPYRPPWSDTRMVLLSTISVEIKRHTVTGRRTTVLTLRTFTT